MVCVKAMNRIEFIKKKLKGCKSIELIENGKAGLIIKTKFGVYTDKQIIIKSDFRINKVLKKNSD
jgi:hypothetical protein